ncbi:hypothetical protein [Phenylobacterium sp.]|uniref:hypothetical protein n=1 Tax=Phenylobacterium sp. TaxID=1871053 RepID=UPI00122076BD|nr:hypothetical protein [Phenylobacterium sp.]THD60498.1 MAG: hypothetical protein E8A49_13765 [Phenylobacterium sp.]
MTPQTDDLDFRLPVLAQALVEAKTLDALEAALSQVSRLTPRIRDGENFGRRLFTRGLDAGLARVSRALQMQAEPLAKSNDNLVIVASQFYSTGGHTRVAADIVRGLGPDRQPLLVMTNMGDGGLAYRDQIAGARLTTPMGERAQLILGARTYAEKAIELFQVLQAVRPTRIILMCHPFDAPAIVGCWPFRDIVEFAHHADHVPALGASMAWSAHVDLTYSCYGACRGAGVNPVYAGMTSTVTEAPPHIPESGRLRMATCGDQRKYVGEGRFRWADWAVAALRAPGAEMRHIGVMAPDFQQDVHKALAGAGIDPARYVFAGLAPSLPADLLEHGIDLYVSSYPFNGGKANLEAMLLGLPLVAPEDPDLPPLLRFSLPLPGWVHVSDPEAFPAAAAEALALAPSLQSRDQVNRREREIGRFARWVAGEALEGA